LHQVSISNACSKTLKTWELQHCSKRFAASSSVESNLRHLICSWPVFRPGLQALQDDSSKKLWKSIICWTVMQLCN